MLLETNQIFRNIALSSDLLHPLTQEDVGKVQNILLECLNDFDIICRKYGLRYVLCGGTALGAVRHGGFIPWDEDADIGMPRSDFDRFCQLFDGNLSDKYWLQTIHRGQAYDLNFVKLRKKGTTFCELFEQEPEIAGVFVDIYPIENVPDGRFARILHGKVSDLLLLCASCVRISNKWKRIQAFARQKEGFRVIRFKAALGRVLSVLPIQLWCRLHEKWVRLCHDTQSKDITIPTGRHHYFGEMCSRSSFFPEEDCAFESLQLRIMKDPSEYLKKQYGDYSAIPQHSQREQHSVVKMDLGEKKENIR